MSRLWQDLDGKSEQSPLFDEFGVFAERALTNRTMKAEMEAASWLDMRSHMGLLAAVRGFAETVYSAFPDAGGGILGTVTDLFAVPLVGNLAAIDSFTADEANLSRIAASFRTHGLAAGDSRVSVMGPALSAAASAMATPTEIRDLVLAFERACLGIGTVGKISRLMDRIESADADGLANPVSNAMGGRLLVGARLRPDTFDAVAEFLGSNIGDGETPVAGTVLHRWLDAMDAIAQEAGGAFRIGLPGSWRAGLLSVAPSPA